MAPKLGRREGASLRATFCPSPDPPDSFRLGPRNPAMTGGLYPPGTGSAPVEGSNAMTRDKRNDRAARMVVEAAVAGDKATCAKYRVSLRTLQRYRRQIEKPTDPELGAALAAKKELADREWIADVPGLLVAAGGFLRRAAVDGDPKDPQMGHSVAGAMKLAAETSLHWQVVGARLRREAGQGPPPARQDPPAGGVPIRPPA